MKVTYIYHSGFLVETAQCYYLFDYYKGQLPALDTQKPRLVFASHRHPDHYNPEIFSILREYGMTEIIAILSKDIPPRQYPMDILTVKVTFHTTYELPFDTRLYTLLSTDTGVAFLIQCPDGTIYHAGDLNDWGSANKPESFNKQMTGSYRHELQLIKNVAIDVAFVPLDPRLGNFYAKGILVFLKLLNVAMIYPMHYWERPQVIDKFLQEHPKYFGIIQNTEASH